MTPTPHQRMIRYANLPVDEAGYAVFPEDGFNYAVVAFKVPHYHRYVPVAKIHVARQAQALADLGGVGRCIRSRSVLQAGHLLKQRPQLAGQLRVLFQRQFNSRPAIPEPMAMPT